MAPEGNPKDGGTIERRFRESNAACVHAGSWPWDEDHVWVPPDRGVIAT